MKVRWSGPAADDLERICTWGDLTSRGIQKQLLNAQRGVGTRACRAGTHPGTCRLSSRALDSFRHLPTASGFISHSFPAAPSADFADSFVNDALQLLRVGVRITGLDVLNCAMKHTPSRGIFDEFGEVSFFHALSSPGALSIFSLAPQANQSERTLAD